jgi:hypothetical protein
VINIRTGKLPENSPQQKAIISELESKGIILNNRFLSTINLWDAYSNLENYQKQFRILFGKRVDNELLLDLDKDEFGIMKSLMLAWIYFSNYPRTALGNATRQIPLRINQQHQRKLEEIKTSLDVINDDSTTAQIIETDQKWNNEPSLWIQLDVQTPLDIYKKVEELIHKLREIFISQQYGDPDYFLNEMYCKYLVIIPTVQGKIFEEKVWPLQTSLTLTQDHDIEEKPYLYIAQDIPLGVYEEMGLKSWQIEDIDIVNKFDISFSELFLRISLLGKMSELAEFPDVLVPSVEFYMEVRSEEIRKTLQAFIDSAAILIARFNDLPDREKPKREQLHEAVQALIGIKENILPKDDELKLPLNEMQEYSQLLQETIAGECRINCVNGLS